MPEATPFTALGVGNGFPFCPNKFNVSDYDYWTTLSGVNKDNPETSDSLIAESRRLGMKIYWNLYSMKVDIETSTTGTINQSASLDEVTMLYQGLINGDTSSALDNSLAEPKKRACRTNICAARNDSNPDGTSYTSAYAQMDSRILELYNGSVHDPDLFVGYGFYINTTFAQGTSFSSAARAVVSISSFGNESSSTSNITYDHAYTTLSSLADPSDEFNVFCKVDARSTVSNRTLIANASGLSGSASSSTELSSYAASAKITSIDFYTYT